MCPTALLVAPLALACSLFVSAARPEISSAIAEPPGDNMCGPNAVYVMLLAHRLNADPPTRAAWPYGADGMSLVEVRDALAAHGLSAEIRLCSPEQLHQCPLPCILYLDKGRPGHYVVVFALNHDHFDYVDPSRGKVMRGSLARLPQFWSGYAVLVRSSTLDARMVIAITVSSVGLVWAVRSLFRRRNPRRAVHSDALLQESHST